MSTAPIINEFHNNGLNALVSGWNYGYGFLDLIKVQ
jgi:hypothetical protein